MIDIKPFPKGENGERAACHSPLIDCNVWKIRTFKVKDQGWVDADNPSTFYKTRDEARKARQGRLNKNASNQSGGSIVTNITIASHSQLTQLQQKLYDRLTQQQQVDPIDAMQVVTHYGYNKAASYGHMRAAGATHMEADLVVSMNSPNVSLSYGRNRADSWSHYSALNRAVNGIG